MSATPKRILQNLSMLGGASVFAAFCAFISVGFNTRSLGPSEFGVLSLIQGFSAFVAALATLESWQSVVRLGARFPDRLSLIISIFMMLDVCVAFLATLVAVMFASLLGKAFGISPDHTVLTQIYCVSLLGGVTGTPKGYFRFNNRFGVVARNQAWAAISVMIASILLWWTEAALFVYVLTFGALAGFFNLLLLINMIVAMKTEGIGFVNPLRKCRIRFFKLTILMAFGVSLVSTFTQTRRPLALFIVGGTVGEAAAGLYSVAARLVTVVSRVTLMLNHVIFPEIMKSARKLGPDVWRRMVWRMTFFSFLLACALSGLGALLSKALIVLAAGETFVDASGIFIVLFAAECMTLAALHLNPVIQEMLGPRPLAIISAASMVSFLTTSFLTVSILGAIGIAFAVLIASFFTYVSMLIVSNYGLNGNK